MANLHSKRWLIPVFPILTIFSAAFAQQIIRVISTKIPSLHAQQNYLLVGAICLAGCFPAVKTIFHDIKQLRPSTSIQAQQWAKNTFERDSHVIMEYYSMPLVSYPFTIDDKFALAESASYEVYAQAGYDYLIVNSWIYGRYYNADEKNGKYYGFYETLFRDGDLLMEFSPSLIDEGPTIRIYRLSP